MGAAGISTGEAVSFEAVPFKTISVMGDGPDRCSRCEGLKSASPLGRRPMAYFVTFFRLIVV